MLGTSILQAVGWLGWCFSACCAILLVWTLSRKGWQKLYASMAKWLSRSRGMTKWAPIWFSVLVAGALTYAATRTRPEIERDVAVTAIRGDYRYTFQHVDSQGELYGDPFTVDICRDYASPKGDFLKGIILWKLIHTVESDCWSLNPDKHAGYFKRRDSDGNAMFAKGVS